MDIEAEDLDIVFADLVTDVFGVAFAQVIVFQDQLLAVSLPVCAEEG